MKLLFTIHIPPRPEIRGTARRKNFWCYRYPFLTSASEWSKAEPVCINSVHFYQTVILNHCITKPTYILARCAMGLSLSLFLVHIAQARRRGFRRAPVRSTARVRRFIGSVDVVFR